MVAHAMKTPVELLIRDGGMVSSRVYEGRALSPRRDSRSNKRLRPESMRVVL